jgi:hypothetical protein
LRAQQPIYYVVDSHPVWQARSVGNRGAKACELRRSGYPEVGKLLQSAAVRKSALGDHSPQTREGPSIDFWESGTVGSQRNSSAGGDRVGHLAISVGPCAAAVQMVENV